MAIPDVGSGTLYIDGKWRHAASGQTFAVTNPATSEVLAQISAAETDDVRDAVNAAASAFGSWSARTAYERAGFLYDAHRLMLERADELARVMTMEQGKPLRTARIEVQYAADFLI
ncbi:MAG: aldehyde dehydrogenase family protein, partial [Streptosporangiaceae bacterium]